MLSIFRQHCNSKGDIDDQGLARLSAHTLHVAEEIAHDVFELFLTGLREEGFKIPVEKFQQARYH
jgi:hypothetical protein